MTDTYKKAVLAGGCFWVRNGMGPISPQEYFLFSKLNNVAQDPASSFVNEVIQRSDRCTALVERRDVIILTMHKKIVLAGGCFWGLEDLLRTQPGVIETEAGYTGGKNENPTYESHPGHAEAVEITYDPAVTSYKNLLDFFFQIHNPTTLNQQGNDRGTAYRSAIFYANDEEKEIAEEMIDIVNESGRWNDPVVTTLEPLTRFWAAEAYHQDYLQRNVGGYTCHAIYFDSYLK